MPTDIDIAQKATMQRISKVALEKLGIAEEHLEPYGHYKAKVSLDYVETLKDRPEGKLILVTAISPTPAGEGKTTTTVGLGDALNHIGKRAAICLREPSLGPGFGMKGGAAGGGRERPRAAGNRRVPRRPRQRLPAPGRVRYRGRLRSHGDLLPRDLACG